MHEVRYQQGGLNLISLKKRAVLKNSKNYSNESVTRVFFSTVRGTQPVTLR